MWDLVALLEWQSYIIAWVWGRDGVWGRPALGSGRSCDWQSHSARRVRLGGMVLFARLTLGKKRGQVPQLWCCVKGGLRLENLATVGILLSYSTWLLFDVSIHEIISMWHNSQNHGLKEFHIKQSWEEIPQKNLHLPWPVYFRETYQGNERMTAILWDVQKKQEAALPQSPHTSKPFLQVLSLQVPFLAQKTLSVLSQKAVFTRCCKWAGSIHLRVRYAYILSLVTPLRCFLVSVFPHVKAAQRKTDFKGMLLTNAKKNRVHLW